MKSFYIIVLLVASQAFSIAQSNSVFNEIADSFIKNNADAISSKFAETLDLSLESTDGTFGKQQASVVLKDFLSKNKIKSFKIKHNGASNERTEYAIAEMKSPNDTWSVYILINTNKKITQLQIEKE